jgi:tetratricopeptide (TPR) repeat protein
MGIISKLFGSQSSERQKNVKFQKLEKQYDGSQEMINFTKAAWLTSRGNHYGQQGKFDQAIIDFKEAIEFKPDHIPAHLSLGIAYREKRMLHEALATLNKAPHKTIMFGNEIGGDEFDLYNAMASVYLLMGDNSKTISYAKKAIEAVKDPERKEQLEFAKRAGVINEKEDDDSQMIEMLKRLIHELEGK